MLCTFTDFIECRLLEVSEHFPRHEYNGLFDNEIEDLIRRHPDVPELRTLPGFDWVGYIAKSLRNAGFPSSEIDSLAQDVVVKLLVRPGNLFRGWDGQPLFWRFRRSVKNALLNIIEKHRVRRKYLPSVTLSPATDVAAQSPNDDLIQAFRDLVGRQLGPLAVAVLDARLEGRETKGLVGQPSLGFPSASRIKATVQQIKAVARTFGEQMGMPWFTEAVAKMIEREAETVGRRLAAVSEHILSPLETVVSALQSGIEIRDLVRVTGLSVGQVSAVIEWLRKTGRLEQKVPVATVP